MHRKPVDATIFWSKQQMGIIRTLIMQAAFIVFNKAHPSHIGSQIEYFIIAIDSFVNNILSDEGQAQDYLHHVKPGTIHWAVLDQRL